MKQKYVLSKDDEKKQFAIKEYAELDKDILSLLCEEIYESEAVAEAIESGKEALIRVIRTRNLFPPSIYMNPLADAITDLFRSEETSADVFFDDIEFLIRERGEAAAAKIEDEAAEIEELLDETDEISEEFGEDDTISSISSNASIKIADDESLDVEDEG
ncbi:hypothetical protein DENIS_0592 [Desulfonema ishimotonii]|uniref:Uncharacterized protein n=1 Tax=Desulfonema ishimotonii TaxID=45657 RepID=A0A401FRR5_9BACT|nr:hypothetical protein [Desulfonema ishimotonii]GBC59651.1 hypothetical protein DENIS_0592 [Desulfonema ishimotonii]